MARKKKLTKAQVKALAKSLTVSQIGTLLRKTIAKNSKSSKVSPYDEERVHLLRKLYNALVGRRNKKKKKAKKLKAKIAALKAQIKKLEND